jgi:hypothetical protein
MEVSDNAKGLALAVASSAFIGASFILKKIGLLRAGKGGVRAGQNKNSCSSLSLSPPSSSSPRRFTRLLGVEFSGQLTPVAPLM